MKLGYWVSVAYGENPHTVVDVLITQPHGENERDTLYSDIVMNVHSIVSSMHYDLDSTQTAWYTLRFSRDEYKTLFVRHLKVYNRYNCES